MIEKTNTNTGNKPESYAPDLEQAALYIKLLTGDADTLMTWHPIKNDRNGSGDNLNPFYGTLTEHANRLVRLNQSGYGIFVAVNACKTTGKRTAADVTSVRAVFVDCDNPESKPLELIKGSMFDFDFITESSAGKFHAYRRVSGMPVDPGLFKGAQLNLADALRGDSKICDLPRVMRVPGFFHAKVKGGVASVPFQTRVHEEGHSERVTAWFDLMIEYDWTEAGLMARAGGRTRGAVKVAAPASAVMLSPPAKRDWEAEASWARKDGDGRNPFAQEYAGHLIGSGLGLAAATEILVAWNARNLEPLPDGIVESIVKRIYERDAAKRSGFNCTELGFAERWEANYGHQFRYVTENKDWFSCGEDGIWSGGAELKVQAAGQRLARSLAYEAAEAKDDDKRNKLRAHNAKMENGGFLKVAAAAKSIGQIPISASELDNHPWLLAVDNGVLDLRTGAWRNPDPLLLLTQRAHVSYQRGAECPAWEKFIDQVMKGDKALVEYLQKILGYCLTGDTSEHALFIFNGNGSNGKSVLINTIESILGGYSRRMQVGSLMKRKNEAAASGDIARLQGARFVATSEPERGNQLNESVLKDMVSGDMQTARFNYGELFSFKPSHKIIMATNHLPIIAGTDHGIWRRPRVVPFDETFPVNRAVGERMAAAFNQESSGILNWMVSGCLAWQAEGLEPTPEAVLRKTGEWREDLDIIGKFLNEACVTPDQWRGSGNTVSPLFRVPALTMYQAYCEYGRGFGYPVMSMRNFGEDFKSKPGITPKKTKHCMNYEGILVKKEWIPRKILEDGLIGTDLLSKGIC